MYKKRKGFTIVELVIVIAVIAVLAAVLIPTFTNLIDKANQSADIQATQQMNVALAAGSIPDAPQTAVEMIEILADAGFNSETCLIPVTKGFRFYWTGPEYNTIVLAQVPDELLNDEPQAQTFALARNVTAESLGIKVICPAEDEEFVEKVEEALLALYNYIKYGTAIPDALDFLFNLADGEEYLAAIVGGEGVVPVTGVTLDRGTLSLAPGETATLSATVAPENATMQDVNWSSDNTDVAIVDQNGNITAVEHGTATITVTTVEGSFIATCEVTVKLPVTHIELSQEEIVWDYSALVSKGETSSQATLRVYLYPDPNINVSYQKIDWEISDESVASMNDSGTDLAIDLIPESPGEATITVTVTTEFGVFTDTCKVELVLTPQEQLHYDLQHGISVNMAQNIDIREITSTNLRPEDLGIIIPENAGNITLDLGGNKLSVGTGGITIGAGSNLTIRNGSLNLTGKIDIVGPTAGLVMNGVTVNSSCEEACVRNYGTATITNCTFTNASATNPTLLTNYGTMTVTGGTITSTSATVAIMAPSVISNTADVYGNAAGATMTLTNVTVDAKYGCVSLTDSQASDTCYSKVTINGGSYTARNTDLFTKGIMIASSCTVEFTNGVAIHANSTSNAIGNSGTIIGTKGTEYTVDTNIS